MTFETWLAFVAASTVVLLVPGPTILLVLSYALSQGRSAALAMVAGVALGDFIAMTASLVGLGSLLLASATLFSILKWIGAAYLIYLGFKLYKSASNLSANDLQKVDKSTSFAIFGHAATITALNPKSIVFFIAFVPQFISVNSPLLPQFSILIVTFVGFAMINALAYALLADKLRSKITKPQVLPWFARIGGSVLMLMGIVTLTLKRSS